MKYILAIDTSSNREIEVELRIDKKEFGVMRKVGRQRAQVVLSLIDSLLKKYGVALHNIDGIEVNTGPGSFTGLRVGIAVANTLAYCLGVPVNGKAFVEPHYE